MKKASKKVEKLVSQKNFKTAAEICYSHDDLKNAAELYLKGNQFIQAAPIYEQMGNIKKAAETYRSAGTFFKAAELFQQIRDNRNAAFMYEKAGFYDKAAELFAILGDHIRAARFYEMCLVAQTGRSLEQASRNDLVRRCGQLYEKAGDLNKASQIYTRNALFNEAAQILEKQQDYVNAAENYLRGGNLEMAANAFSLAGDEKRSCEALAKMHMNKGLLKEAASLSEKAGDFGSAAEAYHDLAEFRKAAEAYYKAKLFEEAGEHFIKVEDFLHAAEAYEEGGYYVFAARALEMYGDTSDKVAEMYERGKRFLEAGHIYKELGQFDRAMKILQKIEMDSEDYRDASILIGEIFLEKKMYQPALERFQNILVNHPFNKSNIELYYLTALCHEMLGNIEEAMKIYEKILSEDFEFNDVWLRLEKLKTLPAGTTITPPHMTRVGMNNDIKTPVNRMLKNRYELIEEMGRGGMGIVYKANDKLLNRIVAYKVLNMNRLISSDSQDKFLKEAQITAKLNHRNIVTIFDIGMESDNYFITMEYVEGKTLFEHLKRKRKLKVAEAMVIVKQICRALVYAHKMNIVHRDIKPSNIMLSRKGSVKLMDFGIARILSDTKFSTTVVTGTPVYMSPEQITGKGIDCQTDIYSLGIVFFELLTGRPPFIKGDLSYHHLHSRVPLLMEIDPSVPDNFNSIVLKCLEKEKQKRYKKADEILEDFARLPK
jgi:tetratricopeptide (TPR) repeat protein